MFAKMDKIFDKECLLKWTRYLIKNVCKIGQDIWSRTLVKLDKIFDKECLKKWTRYLIKNVCKNGQNIW
jgi:hypothetical protein